MNFFDKKLTIFFIFLFIIICTSIYFFTKDDTYEFIPENELYIQNYSNEDSITQSEIVIHIDGEVLQPGIVSLPINSRISDAIIAAGGTTSFADTSKFNLAYQLKDGQKVYIPSIYDAEEIVYIQNDAGKNIIVPDSSSNSTLININSASQTELETLPGIGTSTALKIVEYRNKNGNFQKLEDLMNVSGIGEAKFNNMKDYICI